MKLSFKQELEKGKYAHTDVYVYHVFINKDVLLLTDKRLSYLEHSDLFGGWRVSINFYIIAILKYCDIFRNIFNRFRSTGLTPGVSSAVHRSPWSEACRSLSKTPARRRNSVVCSAVRSNQRYFL